MWSSILVLVAAIAGDVAGSTITRQNLPPTEASIQVFSLPNSSNIQARSSQISTIRDHFQYGPDVIQGEGVFYPTGAYADEMINFDEIAFFSEQLPWVNACVADGDLAAEAVAASGGLNTLEDWFKFYKNEFKVTVPTGPYQGMLSNGTSDLLFSMERLSTAPFGIRRLKPGSAMSFSIDDPTAKKLTTLTQSQLLSCDRLFYVNHRSQLNLTLTTGRYAGAAEAFFFIHPESGQFLPLSIRLNRGSNLIYTPDDSPNDWLFAKLGFNMNDLWYQQWYHLEATHILIDIVFEAAVRSLNPNHPVYGIMDRLSYQTFAFRLSAIRELINPGGPVDQLFFSSGSEAATYAGNLYHNEGAGDWLDTDFFTNLQGRRLIGAGPPLEHFPFFEDGTIIYAAINSFITTFINSYYANDNAVKDDPELANFVKEAIPAQIINFPTVLTTRAQLITLLNHFAMQGSVIHGVLNSNDPVKSTASLPYHPMSFYKPLPTTKGLTEIIPFMPNLTQSAAQIVLLAAFNRPFISSSDPKGANRTLSEMFNSAPFLDRTNPATKHANERFRSDMLAFSSVVQAREFDENGLSQGMPFVWTALDPLNTPFYLTV